MSSGEHWALASCQYLGDYLSFAPWYSIFHSATTEIRSSLKTKKAAKRLIPTCVVLPIIHKDGDDLVLRLGGMALPVARVCHFCDVRGDFDHASKETFIVTPTVHV
jgi:hypothetical protein